MVADREVFVVGKERLVRAEELADARGVVDRGVEVGVVGDVDGLDEGSAGDGMERGLGGLTAGGFCVDLEERCKGFAKERPGAMA